MLVILEKLDKLNKIKSLRNAYTLWIIRKSEHN